MGECVVDEGCHAALDVFVCGAADPHKAVDVMRTAFQPRRVVVGEYLRGWGAARLDAAEGG
jgi:S-adenosylmethionine/arginine decarboxylase-like enzyme